MRGAWDFVYGKKRRNWRRKIPLGAVIDNRTSRKEDDGHILDSADRFHMICFTAQNHHYVA